MTEPTLYDKSVAGRTAVDLLDEVQAARRLVLCQRPVAEPAIEAEAE